MGTYGTMVCGDITNNLKNCTVKGKYVGGNRLSVIKGSVINSLIGGDIGQGDGTTVYTAYMGMESSSSGTDTIGGTVTSIYNYLQSGSVACFYGTSRDGGTTEKTCNYLQGGEITAFYGGNEKGSVTGDIFTTIEGSAKVTNFYGGTVTGTVLGNVENLFLSGEIGTFYGANNLGTVQGSGVQLFGATMILTDRIAVFALFDRASLAGIDDFTFSFTMNGETLASGSKGDLEL